MFSTHLRSLPVYITYYHFPIFTLADASYVKNVMNVKIDNPADDNSSDNVLISLSFHTLFYAFVRIDGNKEPGFKREMKDLDENINQENHQFFFLCFPMIICEIIGKPWVSQFS